MTQIITEPIAFLLLVIIVFARATRNYHDTTSTSSTLNKQRRPNILLMLTDDQDVLIGGIEHMPLLKKHMIDQGTTFSNYFVHTPVCCPSRSSIFSGRYLHNIPMTNNSIEGNCNGQVWQDGPEQETFAVIAKNAGYQTAFAGKYLNQYGNAQGRPGNGCITGAEDTCRRVPPGWDRWMGLVGNSVYYNYSVLVADEPGENAAVQTHGMDYGIDYLPNVLGNRTLESIRLFSKNTDTPFLIMVAWPTPHDPFTPSPEDHRRFRMLQAHRTPNWNTTRAQNAEKHWFMRQLAAIDNNTTAFIDHVYQLRQEALQTIDRQIDAFLRQLQHEGVLDNTMIIYTSDNGFQLGQHRLAWDKRHLYEHDIRVPMVVRGPGVARKAIIDHAVLNIDLAPTIADLAMSGSSATPERMDGQSFVPLLHNESKTWRSDFLVSYHGEGDPTCGMWSCPPPDWSHWHGGIVPDAMNNTYHCVRTLVFSTAIAGELSSSLSNSMYCRFDDDESFVEFYNLTADPWQLRNAIEALGIDERFTLEARLAHLKTCKGKSCREAFR